MPIPLLIILGPTAAGKSALAVAVAKRCGGEIVSADAFAVYRDMDIGTAKPSADERAAVPHHLIDVVDPAERCDAQRWLDLANAAVQDIHGRGRLPIVAGGTPLYTKALLEGLSAGAPRDAAVRERLHARYQSEGPAALFAELERIDPVYARERHPNDERRIVRALEVHALTGQPYSSFHTTDGVRRTDLRPLLIGLDWPRAVLYERINVRVEAMFAAGLVDEVRRIRSRCSAEALQGVGYKEVLGFIDGLYDEAEAKRLVARNSRHLAKHQTTWYRGWSDIVWLPGDAGELVERAVGLVDGHVKMPNAGMLEC